MFRDIPEATPPSEQFVREILPELRVYPGPLVVANDLLYGQESQRNEVKCETSHVEVDGPVIQDTSHRMGLCVKSRSPGASATLNNQVTECPPS